MISGRPAARVARGRSRFRRPMVQYFIGLYSIQYRHVGLKMYVCLTEVLPDRKCSPGRPPHHPYPPLCPVKIGINNGQQCCHAADLIKSSPQMVSAKYPAAQYPLSFSEPSSIMSVGFPSSWQLFKSAAAVSCSGCARL